MSAPRAIAVVKETVKLRTIPEASVIPMSRWQRLKTWFVINRQPLGSILLGASGFVRVALAFKGHSEVADTLKGIADLLMGVGGVTYAAGTFTPDHEHIRQIHNEVKRRSGQMPAFRRYDDPAAR